MFLLGAKADAEEATKMILAMLENFMVILESGGVRETTFSKKIS